MFLIYTIDLAINLLDVAITIVKVVIQLWNSQGASKIILGGQQVETLGVLKIYIFSLFSNSS